MSLSTATTKLLLITTILVVACTGRVPRAEQPETETPACFRFSYVAKGRLRSAQTCWESQPICTEAMRLVAKYGGRANVRSVGECEVE